MSKKFFLISQVFYPDEVSTAGLFTNLCEKIAARDVEVTVWCAQPSYNTKTKQPSYIKHKGINITYLPSTSFNKDNIIGRLLNYLTFSVSLILKLLFAKQKTPAFVSTNPPYLGFLVALICSIRKRKFSYIVQDIFPDGLIRLKKISSKSLITRTWKKLNRFTLRKSDAIIIIGRDMMDWIKETSPESIEKTRYIPIWHDGKLIQPIPYNKNQYIVDNNLAEKFTIQYSGNMGLWNDMATLGKAINIINNPNIHFMFIGNGIKKTELETSIINKKNNNVEYLPFQPKTKLNTMLSACHVALVSLNKNLEGIAVPSKIMGIMAAGKPVIAIVPVESEISLIVKESKCGIVVEPGNEHKLKEAIETLYNNRKLCSEMGYNARSTFEQKYCTEVVVEQYLNLLPELQC